MVIQRQKKTRGPAKTFNGYDLDYEIPRVDLTPFQRGIDRYQVNYYPKSRRIMARTDAEARDRVKEVLEEVSVTRKEAFRDNPVTHKSKFGQLTQLRAIRYPGGEGHD